MNKSNVISHNVELLSVTGGISGTVPVLVLTVRKKGGLSQSVNFNIPMIQGDRLIEDVMHILDNHANAKFLNTIPKPAKGSKKRTISRRQVMQNERELSREIIEEASQK